MKMSKHYKKICLALGLTSIIGAGVVTAQSGTQTVQATYRNINVTLNGTPQAMSVEPFLVNGSTYVPLAAISNLLGVQADWHPATNTVALTGGGSASSTEIAQLQAQIAALTQQLTAANTELAQYKANGNNNNNNNNTSTTDGVTQGTNITKAQLQKTEDYLNDHFTNTLSNKISMDFALSLSSNKITVTMSYSNKSEERAFNELSQSSIENFMKKVGECIADNHQEVTIEGVIDYNSNDKATFTRNKGNGKYNFEHTFNADKVADEIKYTVGNYFRFSSVGNFSSTSLNVNDVDSDIRENRSTVNIKITLNSSSSFATEWNKLDASQREDALRSSLTNLADDIQGILEDYSEDYDVSIAVYYGSTYSNSYELGEIDDRGRLTSTAVQLK